MTSSSCAVTNLEELPLLSYYLLAKVTSHAHNITSGPKIAKRNFTNGFKNREVSQKKKKKKCIEELDDNLSNYLFWKQHFRLHNVDS